jgi:hypothetical protein
VNVYATIFDVLIYLGRDPYTAIAELNEEALLLDYTVNASRMFDTFATNGTMPKRRFYPTIDTRTFDHPENASLLKLRDDLLELTTLTTKNGATTITSADYVLRTATGRYGQTPYNQIQLKEDATYSEYEYDGTQYEANSVIGVWGYHDSWADAWELSGDTVTDSGGINATVTTITVDDADGDDINGFPYRFRKQQILKIESEYLWLTGVNITDNTLTVRRGMNGSTAATHAETTPISIYRPMSDIRAAMQVLTVHLYRRKDTIGERDERPVAGPLGQLILPAVLPDEVQRILKPHRKESL